VQAAIPRARPAVHDPADRHGARPPTPEWSAAGIHPGLASEVTLARRDYFPRQRHLHRDGGGPGNTTMRVKRSSKLQTACCGPECTPR
jgi:hypothetical protein